MKPAKTLFHILLIVIGLSLMVLAVYAPASRAQCESVTQACPTGNNSCTTGIENPTCVYDPSCIPKCGSSSNCRCIHKWGRCSNNNSCYIAECGDPTYLCPGCQCH
jgi:hypothetical protein